MAVHKPQETHMGQKRDPRGQRVVILYCYTGMVVVEFERTFTFLKRNMNE